MEEISLIDFLKKEIAFFRELLSSLVAEELAYRNSSISNLFEISMIQQKILFEIKQQRPRKFQAFDRRNDIDSTLLQNLKDQLDTLISKVKTQYDRNQYAKNLNPNLMSQPSLKPQVIVETIEDEEC